MTIVALLISCDCITYILGLGQGQLIRLGYSDTNSKRPWKLLFSRIVSCTTY